MRHWAGSLAGVSSYAVWHNMLFYQWCGPASVPRCLLWLWHNHRVTLAIRLSELSKLPVYRALWDELPCAAKVIHPTLFETHDPGARKIMERFEQECQFLSGVRHPNIVQYMVDTGLSYWQNQQTLLNESPPTHTHTTYTYSRENSSWFRAAILGSSTNNVCWIRES